MSEPLDRTPLERCFDKLVDMFNLQRIMKWWNRKFGNPPKYELFPDDATPYPLIQGEYRIENGVAHYEYQIPWSGRIEIDPPSDNSLHVDNELLRPSNPPLERMREEPYIVPEGEYASHVIDSTMRETLRYHLEQELNRNYSNYEFRIGDQFFLHNQEWYVVWRNFANNQRIVLENMEAQTRIVIHRTRNPINITLNFSDSIINEEGIDRLAQRCRDVLFEPIVRDGNYQSLLDEMRCGEMVVIPKNKQPLMDRKYPHACFECKKPLEYKHVFYEACQKYKIHPVILRNYNYHKDKTVERTKKAFSFEKQFKVWWKSSIIKFMCCSCFRKAVVDKGDIHIEYHENGSIACVTARSYLSSEYYENP